MAVQPAGRQRRTRKRRTRDSELGRSQRVRIIIALKKSQGLAVAELSHQLGLSYMGIKQHCNELEREGFLDRWRRPKPVGRPEIVYRLTPKARGFFRTAGSGLTLDILSAAKQLFGAAAAEKLLFAVFNQMAEQYAAEISAQDPLVRAEHLADLRAAEGYLTEFVGTPQPMLIDYHSPLLEVVESYPLVTRLETEMLARVVGVPLRRDESRASDLYCCRFALVLDARAPRFEKVTLG
jgi:predicted ArsR family transcriptional regulator